MIDHEEVSCVLEKMVILSSYVLVCYSRRAILSLVAIRKKGDKCVCLCVRACMHVCVCMCMCSMHRKLFKM